MHQTFLSDVYDKMLQNSKLSNRGLESQALNRLNLQNLTLKSLCSRSFDIKLLHVSLKTCSSSQFRDDLLDKINQILAFFKSQFNTQLKEYDLNQQVIQLIVEQASSPSCFQKNLQNVLVELINHIYMVQEHGEQKSQTNILNDVKSQFIDSFQENINWFVQKFVDDTVFQQLFKYDASNPQQKLYFSQIALLPELVTSAVVQSNHLIVSKYSSSYMNVILSNIQQLIMQDQDFFKAIERRDVPQGGSQNLERNELITNKLSQSYVIFQLLNKLITWKTIQQLNTSASLSQEKNQESTPQLLQLPLTQKFNDPSVQSSGSIRDVKVKNQSFIEQLNQYTFLYMQKALKYYEIGSVPIYYEFIVKIQKIQKEDTGAPIQIDMFLKNKLQKYMKDMFEVIARNINKTSFAQLTDFCTNFKQSKYLGFDILSQLNTYISINEIHYQLNSYLFKVKQQIYQLQGLQNEVLKKIYNILISNNKVK